MLEKDIDEIVNDTQVLMALEKADHFLITHFCKKRDRIETRKCFWDKQSKVWQTQKGKTAICCVAMNQEETQVVGYRTFTDIFNVVGRVAFNESKAVQ